MPEKACIVFWRDDSLRYLKSESGVFKRVKKDDFTFPHEIFKSLPPRPSQMLVSPPMNDVGEFSGFLQALLGSHIHRAAAPDVGTTRRRCGFRPT